MLERSRGYNLLSKEDVAAGKETNWPELEVVGSIRNLSPALWKLTHLTALYLDNNHLTRLPPNISLLRNLRRLDLSNNKLRSLPAEIGDCVKLQELMLNNNYMRMLPYELGKLFQLVILGLKGNPLGPDILQLYAEPNGTKKLLEHMLDNLHVTAGPPPPRPWIPLVENFKPTKPTALFTVMCYNVLCDRYATRQMYGYCPHWALNWEYRKKGILDEVRHCSADIISLQEVETEQFYNFFLPELKRDGYEGIFSAKSRAKTMQETERKHVDGCAIFWRTGKFSLLKEHLVEFNQVAMANAEGSDIMLNRVMTKDNIALAALLEIKDSAWEPNPDPRVSGTPLLVATAHIHWDPEFSDVKLIQTMMLVDQLRRIIEAETPSLKPGGGNPTNLDRSRIQLLLCGDFNSLPESGVIEYLEKGRVPADHADFRGLIYKKALTKMLSHSTDEKHYTHGFNLKSVFDTSIMPYTNYTYDFKGMIDYIFYPVRSMKPLGYLGPISQEWLDDNGVVGCPHPHITSDHFSLLAEIGLCPDGFPEKDNPARLPINTNPVTSSFGGLGNSMGGGFGGGHAGGRMFNTHSFGGFGSHNGGGGTIGQRWGVTGTAAVSGSGSGATRKRNTGNSNVNNNNNNSDADMRQQRQPRSLFLPLETEAVAPTPAAHSRYKSDAVPSRNFSGPAAAAGTSKSGQHNSRSGLNSHIGSHLASGPSAASNNSVLFQPMPALRFPYPPPPIVRRSSSAPVNIGDSGGVTWRAFDVPQKRPPDAVEGGSKAATEDRFKSLLLLSDSRAAKGR